MPEIVALTTKAAILTASRLLSLGLPAIWLRSPLQTWRQTTKGRVDLPPEKRGKAPIAQGWSSQDALTVDELIRQWGEGEPGYNVGIRTGRVNGAAINVVAVDLDSQEALVWAAENLPETQIMTRTARGQHWFYRCPRLRVGNRAKIGGLTIDLRADAGQVVAPTSVHGTGFVYSSVLPWTPERVQSMPLFDPAWFGREAEWEGAEDAKIADGGERRPPEYVELTRKRKRALAYLEHCPGTVPGEGKGAGAECLCYARALVFGLCIPPKEAAIIMEESEWNTRCTTVDGGAYPWSLDELLHKCEDAYRLAYEKPYGWMLLEERTSASTTVPPAEETHKILEGIANEIAEQEAASTWWDFPVEEQEVLDPGKRDWPLSDSGNAERLVTRFGESIRFVEDRKTWMAWDGTSGRWVDRRVALDRCSKIVARKILEEIPALEEAEAIAKTELIGIGEGHPEEIEKKKAVDKAGREIKRLRKWQLYSESAGLRSAMVKLASAEPTIAVGTSIFDQRHMLLNVKNGVLDLAKEGQLRSHNRDYYFTKVCLVPYEADAKCPTWDRCLHDWMGGSDDMIGFLQRAFGYSLTGSTAEQCMFIFSGSGSNGKSSCLSALRTVLGPYATTAPAGLLMETRVDKATPGQQAGLASLVGTRMVIASETDESGHLSEAQVKAITAQDHISAKRMCENPFDYMPTHHVFLATNYRPSITGTDDGIWRRIMLIDWLQKLEGKNRDNGLAEKLMAERVGILAWAVRGCMEWRRRGLDPPDQVKNAVRKYRKEQDTLGAFIAERIVFQQEAAIQKAQLRESYERWCEESGNVPFRAKRFHDELRKRATQEGIELNFEARSATARLIGGLGFRQ